jgi:secernin
MCDTWVALSNATLSHQVIFGKNSDRPIFDCQPLVLYPAQTWAPNSRIQLEYIDIPQVEATYATLGSSPYWCWGYEEGLNEHRVVIGNEAIFTKTFREAAILQQQVSEPELGLLGMDLIRLALERSRSARQAVEVMGALIETYGQYGSGVPTKSHPEGGYDNSFIIADPQEAWVLEAVGHRWAARRYVSGYTSISNQPTIRNQWDAGSPDLQAYALQQGWWPADQPKCFDFARAYIDPQVPRQVSQLRMMRSRQLLGEQNGRITPQWMMRIARDHYEDSFLGGPLFEATDPDFQSICMHVSPANFTWGNTASSCVAILPVSPQEFPVFWWTPGPPCNGCYVPFFVHGSQLPALVSKAGTLGKQVTPPSEVMADTFSPDSYWWLFRQLHDRVKGDPIKSYPTHYPVRNQQVRARFDALEEAFVAELPEVLQKAKANSAASSEAVAQIFDEFTHRCVDRVVVALEELLPAFE